MHIFLSLSQNVLWESIIIKRIRQSVGLEINGHALIRNKIKLLRKPNLSVISVVVICLSTINYFYICDTNCGIFKPSI